MGGGCDLFCNYLLSNPSRSVHAKADPIGQQARRRIAATAFTAAIAVYQEGTRHAYTGVEEE